MNFSHAAALTARLNVAGDLQHAVAVADRAEHGFPPHCLGPYYFTHRIRVGTSLARLHSQDSLWTSWPWSEQRSKCRDRNLRYQSEINLLAPWHDGPAVSRLGRPRRHAVVGGRGAGRTEAADAPRL